MRRFHSVTFRSQGRCHPWLVLFVSCPCAWGRVFMCVVQRWRMLLTDHLPMKMTVPRRCAPVDWGSVCAP